MIRPGCYQPERQLLDGFSHPLEEGAFPWRTEKCGLAAPPHGRAGVRLTDRWEFPKGCRSAF